ncbi:MAG TPA: DUF2817 domain-containing protein [Planctomycetaceae bacterium]|nr:DUF2817 domain-containing protein [Planctomycetaceae bacterium]
MTDVYFSSTYSEARHRFIEAAGALDAEIMSYGINCESQDELAIDVAVIGSDEVPAVVISSGVHGVEGFFGSAIQLALLEQLRDSTSALGIRYVLLHGVNPFGFAHLRRFNEDNVDLNRNFHSSVDQFRGSPAEYAGLNRFLNPESPPSRFEPFKLKALWNIWQNGLSALKESVAGGQHDYPRGLFFAGLGPCKSTQVVQENCDSWIGLSPRIMHVDFHSGLGPFATYKLLLTKGSDSIDCSWYADTFGAECVEQFSKPGGTAYKTSGLFGEWMQSHFNARDYRVVVAEFGTYGVIKVLGAIRGENRAHHYGSKNSASYRSTKKELLECFCPIDPSWRHQVVESGLRIIAQSANAI